MKVQSWTVGENDLRSLKYKPMCVTMHIISLHSGVKRTRLWESNALICAVQITEWSQPQHEVYLLKIHTDTAWEVAALFIKKKSQVKEY